MNIFGLKYLDLPTFMRRDPQFVAQIKDIPRFEIVTDIDTPALYRRSRERWDAIYGVSSKDEQAGEMLSQLSEEELDKPAFQRRSVERD